jgi:putative FmdB family regulatory protein
MDVPIYEYACENCGKRSSALLARFDSPDPACPSCGELRLHRLVSTFATFGGGDDDDFGGGQDFGGEDFGMPGGYGADEFGGAGGYGGAGLGEDGDELGGHHGGSDDLADDDW